MSTSPLPKGDDTRPNPHNNLTSFHPCFDLFSFNRCQNRDCNRSHDPQIMGELWILQNEMLINSPWNPMDIDIIENIPESDESANDNECQLAFQVPASTEDVKGNFDLIEDALVNKLSNVFVCNEIEFNNDDNIMNIDYVTNIDKLDNQFVLQYFMNVFLLIVYDPGIHAIISSTFIFLYYLRTFPIYCPNFPILTFKPGILFERL